jgi:tetratricopeptide (TPR) repeat protein
MNTLNQLLKNVKPLLLLSLFVLGAEYAVGQDEEINKSRRFIDVDHVADAIAPMQEAIKKYPEEADLYYYLGYAQIKNKQYAEAAKSFDAGIKLNPKEAINYAGKGHLSMLEKRPQDAKINLDKALDMTKSKKVPVLKAVTEAYLTDAKFAGDAVALMLKARSINSRDAEVELLLGDAYLLQNQAGSAVSAYENAALYEPTNGMPYFKIGKIFSRSNPPVSLKNFEKAVEVDPGFTLAYEELGIIYYRQKQADKAVTAYEKYVQLSGNAEENRAKLAFIYFMKKDYVKANEIFNDAVKKPDVTTTTWRYYIKSLTESGDTLGAKTTSEQFLQKGKVEEIEAADYIVYSKILLSLKQDSLAVLSLTKASQLDPKITEAAELRGDTNFKNGKYAEAAKDYQAVVDNKEKPGPNDQLSLGRAYFRAEQYVESDTVYEYLLQLYPTNMPVNFEAARVKANIDSTSEKGLAKPLYEKVIELALPAAEKNKGYLFESYKYLGAYYLIVQLDIPKAKGYWEKVLAIDPKDNQALEALKAIKDGSIK